MGIDQVNDAITQMDEATQQNAALVEEAAAAAESLEEQAQAMTDAIIMITAKSWIMDSDGEFEANMWLNMFWDTWEKIPVWFIESKLINYR